MITLRKNDNVEESKNILIAMLEDLLRQESAKVKKQKLSRYGLKMTESMERKVNTMCNLSEAYTFPKGECWNNIEYQIEDIEIAVGQKYSVAYAFEEIKDIKKYVVKSDNGGKASIKKSGLLKATKAGTIIVYPVDKNKNKLADPITIIIKKPAFTEKKISADTIGQTISCNSIVTDIPIDSEVTWYSSKKSVATIDVQTGVITVLKKGTTKIRCEIKNSYGSVKKIAITLKVKIPKAKK